ncbi:aminotransferase class I/II-fold pyridoxal phosphate-dependent enzyme [Dermatophilaceae bacterium Soc4.6]
MQLREDDGLPVDHVADVAGQPLVEDGVNRLTVIGHPVGVTRGGGSLRPGVLRRHRSPMYWYDILMTPIQYPISGQSSKGISESIESAIHTGATPPGARLPSVRGLATELGVAPGTVAAAYRTLRDRGMIETGGRNGTTVRAQPPRPLLRSRSSPLPPNVIDLSDGQPDPALLPSLRLDALAARPGPAAAPGEAVLPELLAVARQRLGADGVPSDFVTVASGGLDAIERVLSTTLRSGELVAVEDPGWPNVLDLLAATGLRTHPLELDSEGPLPQSLSEALTRGARSVIITSRAQNPTGTDLTPDRARLLRRVLAGFPQTLVIEDDHAAELARAPLASLAESTASWAFVRSTSKPYGPDLRLAVVAGDATTIARVESRVRVGSGWISTLLQRLVLELWTDPEAASTVAAAADEYTARRCSLQQALAERGVATGGTSGLNVWVPVHNETTSVLRLMQAGWAVAPGSRFRQESAPGIRITVSALEPESIPKLADDVAAALVDDVAQPLSS